MAELKHTFTSGRMNKDLDERLIPNGEYIDAQNIQISSSEGSDVGAIENILGNEKLSKLRLQNAKTLGSIAYNLKNKIYWIVTSDTIDGIYEYDQKQEVISPILIDKKQTKVTNLNGAIVYSNIDGELIISNFNASTLRELIGNDLPVELEEEKLVKNNISLVSYDPYIKISIPKNTVVKKNTNGEIEFKNIEYTGKKYGNIDLKAVYTSDGILNLSKNNLITGINIIDDLLFWTDNLNQPRRINITSFKKYTDGIFDNDTQIEYATKDPITKQVTKLKRAFTEDDISVIKKAPMYAPSMELFDSVTDGVVDIKYTLNLSNVYIGQKFILENLADYPTWTEGDFVTITSTDDFSLDANVVKADGVVVELSISTISGDIENKSYDCEINLKQKKALYELNFVRFAYRWKYKNGEYSTISPFTEPAFIPDDFKYDGKEAFNYGMINKLQRVVLNNFDLGNDDISEIDILFKEGRNQNIYVLQTKKKLDFTNTFEITKEQIHSVIPNDQLLRAWDNVPKRAKAQEITANRIIYGNYTQNYDVYNEPIIKASTVARQDDLNRTIKSNRTYQIGVAYIDEYNRHTPVLSNDTGAYTVSKDNSTLKNQFSLRLENKPPAWAKHFKYYIKDTSGEYYNLSADRYYQDTENGFTYISFPSSDRNKITNDHYLILKKKHGANEPVLDKDNRYKIIDIFSDPPEFITNRKRTIYSLGDIVFTDDYSGSNGGNTITNRNQTGAGNGSPVEDYATIQMKKVGDGQDSGSGVPLSDANELKPGRFIQFAYGDKTSDSYEIKSVSQHPSGSNEVKVTVTEPFGSDVNIIYSKVAPFNLGDATTNLGVSINILETYSAAGDKEFDGRFFVKLKTNGVLSNSIVSETVGGVSYLAKEDISFNGVFREDYDNGYRNNGQFDNTARYKTNSEKEPIVPFLVYEGGTTFSNINIGTLKYNITFEQATWESGPQFERLSKLIKVGDFVRFKKTDGSPHHETIYEIGAKSTSKRTKKRGFPNPDRDFNQLSLYLIDIETAEAKSFDQNLVSQGQDKELVMEVLQKLDEENIIIKDPAIFETEPLERKTELDIYYETEKAIPIEEHGQIHTLNWYNAISFGNGVESNRIRDDFNAIFIDTGVRASTVLAEPFKEEHKFNGIIWSGIINSRSGTNQSNQFNMANTITKDLLPSYGSVQKLFARDSDLVIYCEDKIVRALADKDILYNADGSANVTASRSVIGNIIPFTGEYGISSNPESFAYYGFRAYNADPKRGVVLRLSKDGLTPISAANMGSYFRETLYNLTGEIIGSYDNRNKLYNLSYGDNTVCFSEDVNGWVTFKTFLPQNGISLNNAFYSYYDGELWQHDVLSVPRNNFYGEQYSSYVDLNINDNPSVVKKYKTLGYEGTEGWKANVDTDLQSSSELTFKEKENKYFVNIAGETKDIDTIDTKNFSAQGIGKSVRRTAITFSTGDVVAGRNGEIIIINGGNNITGPDYILSGDNLKWKWGDNNEIVVTGNGINGGSGTGDTTGGDTISTGGGSIVANDGGGGGSSDGSSDGTGNFSDTGGDNTDVTSEDNYSDQLGSAANTTATLVLNSSGYFYSKPIEITQAPGKKITGGVFTIYPEQGYTISASDFTANPSITFNQDGNNVKATLSVDINQPNQDNVFSYNIYGKATKLPIKISGNVDTNLTNSSINNNDITNYLLAGEYGEEKIITERIITADNGYYLTDDSISIDNNNVFLEKIKLSDTSYKIIESVFIPKNTSENINYTITVSPLEIILPNPKIISKTITDSIISNNGEVRNLIVNGEQNAEFEVVFSNTSGTISKADYKIDVTGKKTIPLVFDASDTAETFTIGINNLTDTDIDNNFGSQTVTLTRNAKGRKSSTFTVNYSNTINNSFTVEDYIGSGTSRQFSFDLTLPSGAYTIGKQPTTNDISFGDNNNNATILLNNIEFDAVNTNILTVSGTLFVTDFQEDESYGLNISSFIGLNVTTTFDYSINASDGNPSGNYTIGATSYTVDGGAGLNAIPSENEYFFTLTPSATYSFKTDIDADDFELLDSSNVDVVSDYAANGELLLRRVGDNIEVGFKTKTFTQPSTSSTFTIRPKVGLTLTETTPVSTVPRFTLDIYTTNAIDGVRDQFNYTQRAQLLKNIDINSDILYQYTLSARGGLFDPSEFTDTNLFYHDNTGSAHVTLATAGTYGSTTITGPFEVNSTYDELTVNILVNLAGDSTLTYGKINLYINNTTSKTVDNNGNLIEKYYLVEVKLAECAHQVNGPNENNIQWSPINEAENRYPKYYATAPVLDNDVRIYQRVSSAEPIPGNIYGFITKSLIQKNNEKLFTVSSKNTSSGYQAGWLFEKGICSLDGTHLSVSTNTTKPKLYNDIIKYSYPISSDIFKNEKQTLTGSVKITDKDAYDALVQDITSKGYNIKPVQGVNVDANTLTFEYDTYFDADGNSTIDFDLLRGANEYGVEFIFDDLSSGSTLPKISATSYEMRRKSNEDQDSNDHISNDILDTYEVYESYNTNNELTRYSDGSNDWDSNATRITNNVPQSGGNGYTGTIVDLTRIPQNVIDNNSLVQYLNGDSAAALLSPNFKWTRSSDVAVNIRADDGLSFDRFTTSNGALTGTQTYIKTGFTVTLAQPTGSAILEYYDLWQKINDGTITSLKIPIDMVVPNSYYVNNEIVPTERLFTTTVDLDGGFAVLPEDGWWKNYSASTRFRERSTSFWNNYYIGNQNIYISETVGGGLVALPNYSGIQFTFGITIKEKTNTNAYMLAFAKLPFALENTFTIVRKPSGVQNYYWVTKNAADGNGHSWDFKYHESKRSETRSPAPFKMGQPRSYGLYDFPNTARNVKFKTRL